MFDIRSNADILLKGLINKAISSHQLFYAIKNDDVDFIKEFLTNEKSLNLMMSPISVAIYFQADKSLNYLLSNRINDRIKNDHDNITPYMIVYSNNLYKYIPLLLVNEIPEKNKLDTNTVKNAFSNILPSVETLKSMFLISKLLLIQIHAVYWKLNGFVSNSTYYKLKDMVESKLPLETLTEQFGSEYSKIFSFKEDKEYLHMLELFADLSIVLDWVFGITKNSNLYTHTPLDCNNEQFQMELSSSSVPFYQKQLVLGVKSWGELVLAYRTLLVIVKRLEEYQRNSKLIDFNEFYKKHFNDIDHFDLPISSQGDLMILEGNPNIVTLIDVFRGRMGTVGWLCGICPQYITSLALSEVDMRQVKPKINF